jgi:hypothetical protein
MTVALAIGLSFALMTAPASAQSGPGYEERGYGGPLYVGPNFHEGGQYTHPIYGSGAYHAPSSSEYRAPSVSEYRGTTRQRSVTRSSDDTREATHRSVRDDKPSETKTKTANTENSSIAVVRLDTTEPVAKPKDDKAIEMKPAGTRQATTENSSIAGLAKRTDTAEVVPKLSAEAKPKVEADIAVNCKKYFPTVGLTISVPCDPK